MPPKGPHHFTVLRTFLQFNWSLLDCKIKPANISSIWSTFYWLLVTGQIGTCGCIEGKWSEANCNSAVWEFVNAKITLSSRPLLIKTRNAGAAGQLSPSHFMKLNVPLRVHQSDFKWLGCPLVVRESKYCDHSRCNDIEQMQKISFF